MMWFIRKMLGISEAHQHQWKTISTSVLIEQGKDGKTVAKGTRYVQQCGKCGIVEKRDLI